MGARVKTDIPDIRSSGARGPRSRWCISAGQSTFWGSERPISGVRPGGARGAGRDRRRTHKCRSEARFDMSTGTVEHGSRQQRTTGQHDRPHGRPAPPAHRTARGPASTTGRGGAKAPTGTLKTPQWHHRTAARESADNLAVPREPAPPHICAQNALGWDSVADRVSADPIPPCESPKSPYG